MSGALPTLTISYSVDFFLAIQFSGIHHYDVASPEYQFDFTCRIPHPKGEFTYRGRSICFDPQTFRDFVAQLDDIRKGAADHAEFREVGHMIDFSIALQNRQTKASIRIKEYQLAGEQTLLSAGFQVEYDLFVNALHGKVTQFLAELHHVETV